MSKWKKFLAAAALTALIAAPSIDVEASTTTYTVQKGDTLFKIATKHETTVAQLKKINNLDGETIYVTQTLKVPTTAEQIVETTYQVVKGDTLSKIAQKTNTTVAQLKEWNNLKNDGIHIGQVLKLNGQVASAAPQNEATPSLSKAEQQIANQLAKETANNKKLSAAATQKYKNLIEEAKAIIGTPYVFGGNSPSGIDCSGLIYYAMNKAGYKIGRTNALGYFSSSTKVKNPVAGDLVFFKNTYIEGISHMGIYLGNNQFIHAGSNGVEITNLKVNYWDSRFVAFKRLNVVK